MDQHEYRKFLAKMFPSKHAKDKVKAGEKLKNVFKMEQRKNKKEESEEESSEDIDESESESDSDYVPKKSKKDNKKSKSITEDDLF